VRLHSKLTRLHATASAKKREKSPGTKERSRKIAPLGDRCVVKSFDMTKKTQKEKRENKKNIFSTISS
jgi:hypothetical protein